jgi:hypothetical protein
LQSRKDRRPELQSVLKYYYPRPGEALQPLTWAGDFFILHFMPRDKNKTLTKEYLNYLPVGAEPVVIMTSTRGKMFSDCTLLIERSTGEKISLNAGEVQALKRFIKEAIETHWPDNEYNGQRLEKLPKI